MTINSKIHPECTVAMESDGDMICNSNCTTPKKHKLLTFEVF